MTYPSFQTTITIQPGDAEHCGECRWGGVYGDSGEEESYGHCDRYSARLYLAPEDEDRCPTCRKRRRWEQRKALRCPACLEAEKKAREIRLAAPASVVGDDLTVSGRLLMECPECHGRRAYSGCHTCTASPHPGWVEVPR